MSKGQLRLLALAFIVAAIGATLASQHPDTLERFLGEQGIEGESIHGSPFPDYTVEGVKSENWSGFLAGLAGVLATLALLTILMAIARRAPQRSPTSEAEIPAPEANDSAPEANDSAPEANDSAPEASDRAS